MEIGASEARGRGRGGRGRKDENCCRVWVRGRGPCLQRLDRFDADVDGRRFGSVRFCSSLICSVRFDLVQVFLWSVLFGPRWAGGHDGAHDD